MISELTRAAGPPAVEKATFSPAGRGRVNPFAGGEFVLRGRFARPHELIKLEIERRGGRVVRLVGESTTAVITGFECDQDMSREVSESSLRDIPVVDELSLSRAFAATRP